MKSINSDHILLQARCLQKQIYHEDLVQNASITCQAERKQIHTGLVIVLFNFAISSFSKMDIAQNKQKTRSYVIYPIYQSSRYGTFIN